MKKSVAIFMALTLILSLSFFAAAETVESADASTMRLARAEGCVFLKDESGTELSYRENMRLYSGNTVATEADSRAGISLDKTKIVTLDEQSFASLHQNGKKLRVKLENGAMYFSVSKPLASDEQFDIETSTMVLGIRGTSGYVEALSPTSSLVILTSGHALITAVSGEEQEINPGQCVVIRLTSSG
ncbi:MAG: FecR domain-containing protein, partial [Oscillospiraceae bacterium]|nr:FecR domain-containing protein [Oscillospiraceae bacterium]